MADVIDMVSVIYKWIDQSVSFEWMIDQVKRVLSLAHKWLFIYFEGFANINSLEDFFGQVLTFETALA